MKYIEVGQLIQTNPELLLTIHNLTISLALPVFSSLSKLPPFSPTFVLAEPFNDKWERKYSCFYIKKLPWVGTIRNLWRVNFLVYFFYFDWNLRGLKIHNLIYFISTSTKQIQRRKKYIKLFKLFKSSKRGGEVLSNIIQRLKHPQISQKMVKKKNWTNQYWHSK